MAGSINKVILIGTLGKDPEMRFLPNGNAVCNLSIATDESYKDKATGQKVEKTEWHRISAFGRLAEIMGEYLKKGSKCYIEGKLETREYEKDGIKRYSTSILANEMTMLDSKNDQSGAPMQQAQQPAYQQPAPQQQTAPRQQQAPAQQQYTQPQTAPAAPYGQPQTQQQPVYDPRQQQTPNHNDLPF